MSDSPRFELSRWLFLRLLALVYLLAFASLTPQMLGLVGRDGILPVVTYLERADTFYGDQAPWLLPTLLWVDASDVTIRLLCGLGMVLSGLALVGLAPLLVFALLWVVYLSLTVGGQTFLAFQWDILLLETGLIACLYAPPGWRPRTTALAPASRPARWLLWGLAFKLTLLSGVTKLVSGDPTWRDLTALTHHYETTPIPVWSGWYVHHLPSWLHAGSAAATFAIELAVPFAILAPARFRRSRLVAFTLLCLLQVGIATTGNYGFFNLLTIVLYASMLDDDHLAWLAPWMPRPADVAHVGSRGARAWRGVVAAATVVIGTLSLLTLWQEATYTRPQPEWSTRLRSIVRPLRSINGYGLFRTMTTTRPEVVIEATWDGTTWHEYPFRWKPGALDRRPGFVQPHMPRLDWQMWFAALDPYDNQYWLTSLAERLLEGSSSVHRLLDDPPHTETPPRAVRLVRYFYRFTTVEERRETGDWWHRERREPLTATITRR